MTMTSEDLELAFTAYSEAETTMDAARMANFDESILDFAEDCVDNLSDDVDQRRELANVLLCGIILGACTVRQIRGEA